MKGPLGKPQDDAGDWLEYRKGQGCGGTPGSVRNCKDTGKGQQAEEQQGSRKRQENSGGKARMEEPKKEGTRRTKKNGRKVQREALVNRLAL